MSINHQEKRMLQSLIITGATSKAREAKISQLCPWLKKGLVDQPDVLIIDQNKNKIGIETVRGIKNWLAKQAYQDSWRLVLVKKAQNLTIEAQNAFLKTLEEPPNKTVLVLSINNHHQLLPTIISRCQVVNLVNNSSANPPLNNQPLLRNILDQDLGEQLLFARQKKETKVDFFIDWLSAEKRQGFTNHQDRLAIFNFLSQAISLGKTNISTRLILDYLFTE